MEVADESDVDSEYISLSHGMGLSMVKFFSSCYLFIQNEQQNFQHKNTDIIRYFCDDCIYEFLIKNPVDAKIVNNVNF